MITKLRYDAGDREGWLKLRSSLDNRLGGSEVGAAANHSPYSSFLRMLQEYVGLVERPDISGKMAVKLGIFNEEFVAREFAERSGKSVHRENCIFINDEFPHLKATIDRKVAGEDSGLECKFMSDMTMRRYPRGEFPETYKDQCVTYLAVTGLRRWYLAIVTNSRFCGFLMTRDKTEEDRYYALKARFDGVFDAQEGEEADFAEWRRDWAWLDAVYYLDEAEMQGAEIVAAHFLDAVKQVRDYMAQFDAQNPDTGTPDYVNKRKSYLTNAIYQVVDPVDIDGNDATFDALDEMSPISEPDKVVEVTCESAEDMQLAEMLNERARLMLESADNEKRIKDIEAKLVLRIKDAEEMLFPEWKISYKTGTARRNAKVADVEAYFAKLGQPVPDGLISTSVAKRALKIYARSADKAKKSRKAKAA